MAVSLDLCPFVVFDPVSSPGEEVMDSDIGCLVGYLGDGVGFLGCIGGSLEDLVVMQFLL